MSNRFSALQPLDFDDDIFAEAKGTVTAPPSSISENSVEPRPDAEAAATPTPPAAPVVTPSTPVYSEPTIANKKLVAAKTKKSVLLAWQIGAATSV